jgi:hypothetical protein
VGNSLPIAQVCAREKIDAIDAQAEIKREGDG